MSKPTIVSQVIYSISSDRVQLSSVVSPQSLTVPHSHPKQVTEFKQTKSLSIICLWSRIRCLQFLKKPKPLLPLSSMCQRGITSLHYSHIPSSASKLHTESTACLHICRKCCLQSRPPIGVKMQSFLAARLQVFLLSQLSCWIVTEPTVMKRRTPGFVAEEKTCPRQRQVVNVSLMIWACSAASVCQSTWLS